MTVSELYVQVARLGFEDSLEDAKSFYHSANRALLQVNSLRPAIASRAINHHPLPNLLGDSFSSMEVNTSTDVVLEALNARAFYFEADGNGVFTIECLNGDSWVSFGGGAIEDTTRSREFRAYYGVIKNGNDYATGMVRITFKGSFLYHIRRVALYGDILSDSPEDVPAFTPFVRYDMSKLTNDFLDFASPPIEDDTGEKVRIGYNVEGNSILLPYDTCGVFRVLYRRCPRLLEYHVDPNEDDTEIDLDEELSSLMPILVAAYVWLEDEEGKAIHYMDIYRERAAQIKMQQRNNDPAVVKNVYGW